MIEVELPDGTIAEFPDGTPPETIRAALQKRFGSPTNGAAERIAAAKAGTLKMSPERAGQQAYIDSLTENDMQRGPMEAFAANLLPGMTFGFADELAAGVGSMLGGGDYATIRDSLRDVQNRQMDQNPVASIGGQIAGALVPGAGTYKLGQMGLKAAIPGANVASLPARVGVGGLTGAMEGAAFGAGTADGAPMAENMVKNAMIGGAAGMAVPGILAALGVGGNALMNALNIPSNVRAGGIMQNLMRRAGMTPDDVARAIQQAQDDGQGVFRTVDALGTSGQRGLAGIARQPGDTARQEIVDFLMKRQAGQGERVSRFVADALDAPDTAAARAAAMTGARDAAADVAFDAARKGAGPVDVRPVLAVIDDRIGPMLGSGVADDGISGKLIKYRGRLAAGNPAASVIKGETGVAAAGTDTTKTAVFLSDFDRIHLLRKEVGDDISAAVRVGRNNEARELGKVLRALDDALEAASPSFKAANADFAKASREIDMVDAGKAATRPSVRAKDTADAWAKMTPEQQAAFRAGFADPVIAKIDAAGIGANKARAFTSDKMAKQFDFLAKDPAKMARQMARENTMFETNVAAYGGSKTADNLADVADMQGFSNSILGNILTGNWGSAGRQVADKVVSAATGASPATREMVARALLSDDPMGAIAASITRAKNLEIPRGLIEALARASAMRAIGQ